MSTSDGSSATRLTNFTSATVTADPNVSGLDWSPDGAKIAFTSKQDPTQSRLGGPAATVTNLWTVDTSTRALFCVTNFATEYLIDIPTYARTGTSLVFSSKQDPATPGTAVVTARNLFTISADGTGLRALTTSTGTAFNAGPYWFGDGKTLLYESTVDPANPAATVSNFGIWSTKLTAGATPAVVISKPGVWDYSPLDDQD